MPSPPFLTGRTMFMASKLRGHKDVISLMGQISKEWTSLPQSEKRAYEARAEEDVKNFKENVDKYIKMHS